MIVNITRTKILCHSVEVCEGFWANGAGLMFRKKLVGGLLIRFRHECREVIWTLGMRFPIDIIWLDSGWKVVDTKVKARPWLYYGVPKTPARMVLEVNWGTIARTGTEVKDILKFDGVKFVKGGQIPSWDNR